MVILGVDPGSRVTGYGLIEAVDNRLRCLEFGAVSIPRSRDCSFADRLKSIHDGLSALLGRRPPSVMAVEEVFYAVNVKSALQLGQSRGVVLLAAAQAGVPLVEYSALEVKKAVVGYGRADKGQIQLMVRTLLGLREVPQPHDAADALAVALCHAFRGSGRIRLQSARSPR